MRVRKDGSEGIAMLIEIILRYCFFVLGGLGVAFMLWALRNLFVHDKPQPMPAPDAAPELQPKKHRAAGPYTQYVT
jgi:hypothetical protein